MGRRFFVVCLLTSIVCAARAQSAADLAASGGEDSRESVLEEIIVTATKREASLADVPVSVAVLSGQKIADADISNIEEMQTYIPNLVITDTALGPRLNIRGIGSGVNQGFEQSVGTYVDGIYQGRAQQSRMVLVDVQRAEVLRGPQSILFGKNSIAGALNITTAQPTDILEWGVTGLYSPDFEQRKLEAFLAGPLTPDLSGRLTAYARDMGGYMENLTLKRDEPNREERLLRGALRWDASNDLSLTLKAEHGSYDTDGEQIEIINDRAATVGPFAGFTFADVLLFFNQDPSVTNTVQDFRRSSNGDSNTNETNSVVLRGDYRGWRDYEITSVTGYTDYDLLEVCDCDFTGGNVFTAVLDEEFEQFSQELRLTSAIDRNFRWLAGVYFLHNDLDFRDVIRVAGNSILVPVVENAAGPGAGALIADTATPRSFRQKTKLYSLFAELAWDFGDAWTLITGARLASETKEAQRVLQVTTLAETPLPAPTAAFTVGLYSSLFNLNGHALQAKRDKESLMPTVEVQYRPSDSTMLYFTAVRGVKSGGFDARSNNAPATGGSFEFDDESANSFELGAKLSTSDRRADLNLALYFTKYDDLQVSIFDGVLGFSVFNAAEAKTRGLELDGRWLTTDKLLLSASLALTHFEYERFFGECYFGQPPDAPDGINCNYAGRGNVLTPDYSGTISADFLSPLSSSSEWQWGWTVDSIISGSYLTSSKLDPRQEQESYVKWNARLFIGAADGRWELALIGKNLTDEAIKTLSGDVPLAGSNFGTPGFSAFYEQPRSIGLQATLRSR
ncbi:MAG: TonB-dependent receptor [Woeseia sp.]